MVLLKHREQYRIIKLLLFKGYKEKQFLITKNINTLHTLNSHTKIVCNSILNIVIPFGYIIFI